MAGCCKKLEECFGADRLDFELDDTKWKAAFGAPSGLAMTCCCCNARYFLAAKFMFFFFWLAVAVYSIVDHVQFGEPIGIYFTRLTNWGVLLELLYFFFAAYSSHMALYSDIPDGKDSKTPDFVSFTWYLSSLMPAMTFTIVVLYWLLVYEGGEVTAVSLLTHGVNFVLALVDMMISRYPYYLAHLWAPLGFSITYAVFTYVYFLLGGTDGKGNPYIYSSIDWRNPDETGSLVGVIVLVGVPLLYTVFFLIAMTRKCCKRAPPSPYQGLPESAMAA